MTSTSKFLTTCIVAAAIVLPIAGHTADYDTDRSSPRAFAKDAAITTKIKAKLAAEKLASAVHIKVDTDKRGVVTLSGKALSEEEVNKAVSIARGVEGVASVENNIQVVAHR